MMGVKTTQQQKGYLSEAAISSGEEDFDPSTANAAPIEIEDEPVTAKEAGENGNDEEQDEDGSGAESEGSIYDVERIVGDKLIKVGTG